MKKFSAPAALISAAAVVAAACQLLAPAGARADGASVIEPDLAVTQTNAPTKVSPPGGSALYTVTVTNKGTTPQLEGSLIEAFTGSVQGVSSTTPGCSVSGTTATCSLAAAMLGGTSQTFTFVVRTTPTAGSVTGQASVSGTLPDGNPADNSSTLTTPVVADPNQSAALVPAGGSLTFNAADGKVAQVLRVPSAGTNGVIASLSEVDTTGLQCGGQACGTVGAKSDFDPNASYQAVDPTHPLAIDVTFTLDPCHGLGFTSNCSQLYMSKNGKVTPLPNCPGFTAPNTPGLGVMADPTQPCVNNVYKVNGAPHWDVRATSTDPIWLPI